MCIRCTARNLAEQFYDREKLRCSFVLYQARFLKLFFKLEYYEVSGMPKAELIEKVTPMISKLEGPHGFSIYKAVLIQHNLNANLYPRNTGTDQSPVTSYVP